MVLVNAAARFKPTRCAIYTRQSVVRPGGDAALSSCQVQRDRCVEFVRSMVWRGWYPVNECFNDEGWSGGTVQRPALDRLLALVRSGEVERVIVYRLDRLTRKLADWSMLAALFARSGIGLTVVSGALDAEGGAIARLQLNTLAIFAELEREMIAERLSDARAYRKARGLRTSGRIPLGYTTEHKTKQFEVFESEARTVRFLFGEAAKGKTPVELATAANTSAHRTKQGNLWTQRAVLRLLQNPAYCGRQPDGSIAGHPAIIEAELFDRVQALVEQRRTREPSKRKMFDERFNPFVLRGLLCCESCGHTMSTAMSKPLTKTTIGREQWGEAVSDVPRYYRCRTPGCATGQVAAAKVELLVLDAMRAPYRRWPEARRARFVELAKIWDVMWPINRRRVLLCEFREIIWRARTSRLVLRLLPGQLGSTNS